MAVTQYIGARYVPIFADPAEWSNTKQYEPLTIVLHQGNSFTSKQFVPTGVDINDTDYWAETGSYNAQVEQYREETLSYVNSIQHKAFAFDTVTEMKESNQLYIGAVCHTNGFHENDDGGASWYKVADSGTANEMDVIALQDNLYANLIVSENYVTPEMFGAYGNGTNDDSDIWFYIVTKYPVICCNSKNDYKITKKLIIEHPTTIVGNNARIDVYAREISQNLFLIQNVQDVEISGLNVYVHNDGAPTNEEFSSVFKIANQLTSGNCKNIYIHDCYVKGAHGDAVAVYIADDVLIENIITENNVRNGFSVVHGNNITIKNCTARHLNGPSLGSGLDIEGNSIDDPINNVKIYNFEACDCIYGISFVVNNNEVSSIVKDAKIESCRTGLLFRGSQDATTPVDNSDNIIDCQNITVINCKSAFYFYNWYYNVAPRTNISSHLFGFVKDPEHSFWWSPIFIQNSVSNKKISNINIDIISDIPTYPLQIINGVDTNIDIENVHIHYNQALADATTVLHLSYVNNVSKSDIIVDNPIGPHQYYLLGDMVKTTGNALGIQKLQNPFVQFLYNTPGLTNIGFYFTEEINIYDNGVLHTNPTSPYIINNVSSKIITVARDGSSSDVYISY